MTISRIVMILALALAAPLCAQEAKLHKELEAHRVKMAREAARYVVSVEIEYDRGGGFGSAPQNMDPFFRADVGPFSGVVMADNHVLICDKCLGRFSTKGADQLVDSITVTLSNGDRHKATVIGRHQELDLALLKVEVKLTDIKDVAAVKLPQGDVKLERGQEITVVGRGQNALRSFVNRGVVSALEREGKLAFQLDARVGNGTLGAPVIDNNGAFVGVVSLHEHGRVGQAAGVSNAVYAHEVRKAYDLMKGGKFIEKPPQPFMGVSTSKMWPDKPGLKVGNVIERSGAQRAGIQIDDIILKVDGVEMNDTPDLQSHIMARRVGDVVKVTVLRGEEELEIEVTLGARE